jgi:hypothetical protein
MTDTCSIGRVIDALTAIPAKAEYASLFAGVEVVDGPWPNSNLPDELVLIGLTAEGDPESGGDQMPRTMGMGGGGTVQEDYGIICQILCWTGDSDSGAQKRMRDRAEALLAAFETEVHTNPTLNGLITLPQSGQPITTWIERVGMTPVSQDVETGRIAIYQFTVHVRNSLR